MDTLVTSAKTHTRLIFTLTFVMGLILSGFVYFATQKITTSTRLLIDEQIPNYQLLQDIKASQTKLNLVLYEYYATNNQNLYTNDFNSQHAHTSQLISNLRDTFNQNDIIRDLEHALEMIWIEAQVLNQNMSASETDWDDARDSLLMVTKMQELSQPFIDQLSKNIKARIEQTRSKNETELQYTNFLVLTYSISIIILTVIMAKTLKSYALQSAKSRRLALFPIANPNPIISLDDKLEITYQNPASEKLVKRMRQDYGKTVRAILPPNLSNIVAKSFDETENASTVTYQVEDKYLQADIHKHESPVAYDIHIQDVTEQTLAQEKLNYQAYHDQTSGLENGHKLIEEIDYLTSTKRPFALGMIEIRDFNQLLSGQGIDISIALIQAFAQKLASTINNQNNARIICLFHTSDNVFSLILQGQHDKQFIENLCFEIEKEIEQPLMTNCGELKIELDFGFCHFPEHGKDRNTLTKHSRAALDQAISLEHSSFILYSEKLGQHISQDIQLLSALKQAIKQQDLLLNFQPQYNILENRLIGMEVLIRWQNQNKWVSPADFIPLAERSGLIIPLGEWILKQACKQTRHWHQNGHPELVVAVNISPRQFRHPNFVNLVEQVLKENQLPANKLELEITEGVILGNENDTIDVLNKLRSLGVMLSIDDFGTGYSSLCYLSQFPIDKLKIDQAFIKKMHENKADQAIVRTVIELGKNLDLTLIAEGVEEQAHVEILKQMGCHEIQGYHYSRPLQSEAFEDFINNHAQLSFSA